MVVVVVAIVIEHSVIIIKWSKANESILTYQSHLSEQRGSVSAHCAIRTHSHQHQDPNQVSGSRALLLRRVQVCMYVLYVCMNKPIHTYIHSQWEVGEDISRGPTASEVRGLGDIEHHYHSHGHRRCHPPFG